MTAREKKLAILFGAAGFLLVNAALYLKVYEPMKKRAVSAITSHELTLKNAGFFAEMRDQYADEIEWFEKNQPKTAASQEVEAELQRFAQTESSRNGLTIKRQRILPAVQDPGALFHRARIEMQVSGKENALYRWLHRLQTPTEFRALTGLDLSPEREDDTLIECKVVIEEWFTQQDEAMVSTTKEEAK